MQVNPTFSYNKYYYTTYSLGNVGRHRLDSPGQHEINGIIHFIWPDQSGKFPVTAIRRFALCFDPQRQSDDDRKQTCARRDLNERLCSGVLWRCLPCRCHLQFCTFLMNGKTLSTS